MAIDKLLLQIDTFKQNIINAEKINTKVSQSKVGWQIEHSLLVVIKIAEQLQNSNPKNYKAKFSVLKTIVFFTAKIPRGKAKAPKSVMPGAIQNPKQLEDYIALAKQKINILNSLNENNISNIHYLVM
ncbi:hypothetical protein [Ferruginibacter sp.]